MIAHANDSQAGFNQGFDFYVTEIDAALDPVKPLGKFLDCTLIAADNPGVMSPCLLEHDGRWCLFFNIGPRLRNKIALAVADSSRPPAAMP